MTSYTVEHRPSSTIVWSSRDVGDVLQYTLSGLLHETEYFVRVAANSAQGVGSFSNAESAITCKLYTFLKSF